MADNPTQHLSVKGQCLCGECRYDLEGDSFGIIFCYCQRCRKHTGAAVVGFVILASGEMRWRSGENSVRSYRTEATRRSWCITCGSTINRPGNDYSSGGGVFAGNILDMDSPIDQWHLYMDSKCPWTVEPSEHKHFARVPPEFADQEPNLPELQRRVEPGRITGSCLCGDLRYAAASPTHMMNCHCTRCRLSRGAPYATNLFTRKDDFEWLSGAELVEEYKLPTAERFGTSFCRQCGSLAPRVFDSHVLIPAGGLDSDPGIAPAGHMFTGSMARWFSISDDVPQWTERPT